MGLNENRNVRLALTETEARHLYTAMRFMTNSDEVQKVLSTQSKVIIARVAAGLGDTLP